MIANLFKAVVSIAVTPITVMVDIVTLPVSAMDNKDPFRRTAKLLGNASKCLEEAIKPKWMKFFIDYPTKHVTRDYLEEWSEIKAWKLAWQESKGRELVLHAREAMLVEALEQADVHAGMLKIRNALRNSTEHVDKWLAEVRAETMEDLANTVDNNLDFWICIDDEGETDKELAQYLREMAQEIRSGK